MAKRGGKKKRIAKMAVKEEAANTGRDFDRDRAFMERMHRGRKKR